MISRRTFLRSPGSLLGPPLRIARPVAVESLKVSLAMEFANARHLCDAPDGTRICLEDWKTSGYPIRVVELGMWKTIYTGRFQQRALEVEFFADGQALFLDFAWGKGGFGARQIVVDIKSGGHTTRMHDIDPVHYFESMRPIENRELLVTHYGMPGLRMEWLSRIGFSAYQELQRTTLPSEPSSDLDGSEGVAISPDGKLLAVSVREAGKKGDVLPGAHIYDVTSGARIAAVVHDRIPPGRRQWLVAHCGVSFTSDGRYLVTSGMVTKVWNICGAP